MSLLPRRGQCFHCGHDHGEGMGSPHELQLMSRIGELEQQLAAAQAAACDRPSHADSETVGYRWRFNGQEWVIGKEAPWFTERSGYEVQELVPRLASDRSSHAGKDMRPCYSSGRPAHEHRQEPDPRGGMRIGICPTSDHPSHAGGSND